MDRLSGPGRDLVIVQRDEDILSVSSCDAIAVFVDDKVVDEVGPFVDLAILSSTAADTDDTAGRFGLDLEPQLVRIDGPLGQMVSDLEGTDDRLEQVRLAGLKGRDFRSQRSDEFTFEGTPFAHTEDIDAGAVFEDRLGLLDDLVIASPERQCGVSAWEEVVVHDVLAGFGVRFGGQVVGFSVGHMTAVAIGLGFFWVIETPSSVACNTAEQIRIVVVLTSHPIFVFGQISWQVDLMTGAAELCGLESWLEHFALVKRRLGLDHQHVDLLEQKVFAVGKRIVLWFFDDVIGIASCRFDFGNRMADRAGDPSLTRRVVDIVVVWVVKRSGEEGYRVVATGTKACCMDVAIAFERDLARLANGIEVSRVVKRAEVVGAVKPIIVDVLMALLAVIVVHQYPLGDEVPVSGASQRVFKVLLPVGRCLFVPFAGVLGLNDEHRTDGQSRCDTDALCDDPTDAGTDEPVEPIEPHRAERSEDVGPVDDAFAHRSTHEFKGPELDQQHAADEDHYPCDQQRITDPNRPAIASLVRRFPMEESEGQERDDQDQSEHQMEQEHVMVKQILKRPLKVPLREGHSGEIHPVGQEDREQTQDGQEEFSGLGGDRQARLGTGRFEHVGQIVGYRCRFSGHRRCLHCSAERELVMLLDIYPIRGGLVRAFQTAEAQEFAKMRIIKRI